MLYVFINRDVFKFSDGYGGRHTKWGAFMKCKTQLNVYMYAIYMFS